MDETAKAEELAQVVTEARAYLTWASDAGLGILAAAAVAPQPAASAYVPAPARLQGPAQDPASARAPAQVPAPANAGLAQTTPNPGPAARAQTPAQDPTETAIASRLKLPTLQQVRDDLGECTRCKLHKTRTKIVFGSGEAHARLMFVGEAPGEDEDLQGEPFIGKAGQLLTKMIEAMGLSRETVYICNTVKCRPPNNRNPEPDELGSCEPFLKGQLAAVKPEVIVTLGKFAAQALLRDQTPISRLRGIWREYQGIALMPTFHPAYLLRSPGEKGKVWGDLQDVMKKLGLRT